MGADDYVVKPFSAQELVSRVRAVLRRASGAPTSDADEIPLDFGDLVIVPWRARSRSAATSVR